MADDLLRILVDVSGSPGAAAGPGSGSARPNDFRDTNANQFRVNRMKRTMERVRIQDRQARRRNEIVSAREKAAEEAAIKAQEDRERAAFKKFRARRRASRFGIGGRLGLAPRVFQPALGRAREPFEVLSTLGVSQAIPFNAALGPVSQFLSLTRFAFANPVALAPAAAIGLLTIAAQPVMERARKLMEEHVEQIRQERVGALKAIAAMRQQVVDRVSREVDEIVFGKEDQFRKTLEDALSEHDSILAGFNAGE